MIIRNLMVSMQKTFLVFAFSFLAITQALAAGGGPVPPKQNWSWTGFFGDFDKQSAQRGLQVYKEVCAACHGLNLVKFRHLERIGYDEGQIKTFAAEHEILDGPNSDGEMFTRTAVPADAFPSPFVNEQAARESNNGAYPVDLSLIVKSRNMGNHNVFENFFDAIAGRGTASGADYLFSLLTGYGDASSDVTVGEGMYYNKWFNQQQIAMPAPLSEGLVEYGDGTEATVEQMARDVSTFLAWASEPEIEERRFLGLKVMLFLGLFIVLLIITKRKIWRDVK